MSDGTSRLVVRLNVNGDEVHADVEARRLLSDFLRHDLKLTGTHIGCEQGACGACTVLVDGEPVRSCLMFTVQANGRRVTTVEAVSAVDAPLHPIQQAFHECHALQCGFCTPGFVMSLVGLLDERPAATDEELLDAVSGTLCRCTGYQSILAAARLARDRISVSAHEH